MLSPPIIFMKARNQWSKSRFDVAAAGMFFLLAISMLLPEEVSSWLYRSTSILNDINTCICLLLVELVFFVYLLICRYMANGIPPSRLVVVVLLTYLTLTAIAGFHAIDHYSILLRQSLFLCLGPLLFIGSSLLRMRSAIYSNLSYVFEIVFIIYAFFAGLSKISPQVQSIGGMVYHTGGIVRLSSIMGQPNFAGSIFACGVVFYVSQLYLHQSRARKYYLLLTLNFLIDGLLATYSRGAWIACLSGVAIVLLLERRRLNFRRLIFVTTAIFLFLFLYVSSTQTGPGVAGRIITSSPSSDDSVRNRILVWKASAQLIKTHPLFGTGYGTFMHAISAYKSPEIGNEQYRDAVNSYITLAAEAGVPTLILYLILIFIVSYKYCIKRPDDLRVANSHSLFSVVCTLIVFALTSSTLSSWYFLVMTWQILGFISFNKFSDYKFYVKSHEGLKLKSRATTVSSNLMSYGTKGR